MDSPSKSMQSLCALRVEMKIATVKRDIWRKVVASKRKILEEEKLKTEKLTEELIANREKFVETVERSLDKHLPTDHFTPNFNDNVLPLAAPATPNNNEE